MRVIEISLSKNDLEHIANGYDTEQQNIVNSFIGGVR